MNMKDEEHEEWRDGNACNARYILYQIGTMFYLVLKGNVSGTRRVIRNWIMEVEVRRAT